jgi:hypothetical protein
VEKLIYSMTVSYLGKVKGTAIPIHAWKGCEGCRRLRLPEFLHSRRMKVAGSSNLCTRCLYLPEIFLVLNSFRGCIDPRAIMRSEVLSQCKIPMTWLGIKPVTYQLVAQCLNQLHQHIPQVMLVKNYSYLNVMLLVGGRTFLCVISTHTIMVLVLIMCVFSIADV